YRFGVDFVRARRLRSRGPPESRTLQYAVRLHRRIDAASHSRLLAMTLPRWRVLVANRGEIALRIVRACRDEGLESVAVYSDADRNAPFVRAADRSVRIGPAAPAESYLHIDRLIAAARESGADAVHPGYGFLSERAAFAEAVTSAGLVFVGPPASAIAAMGDKTSARRLMAGAGVPIVPGSPGKLGDPAEAAAVAERLGFPVLVKAAAGGGGKGMRVVHDPH